MWSQGHHKGYGSSFPPAAPQKVSSLAVLPSTVSQLLSTPRVNKDGFGVFDMEHNQVSVVGVVRGCAPFVTNMLYYVDDMTGPPLAVKQWINEDPAMRKIYHPGTYVKVIGSLRSFSGQRTLLAMGLRPIEDLNEITSHMMEVVRAQTQLYGKGFDVNMNTTAAFLPGRCGSQPPQCSSSEGSSVVQQQVLEAIRSQCMSQYDVSLDTLKRKLTNLGMEKIRSSLSFLLSEGHIFATRDEHHFKATED